MNKQLDKEKETCDSWCPVQATVAIIQGKWTLMILRDLFGGTRRFGDLLRSLKGVSPKTLSLRLKELEEAGVLIRTVFPEVPPRVEYALTEKGRELKGLIDTMAQWGLKWKQDNESRRETARQAAAKAALAAQGHTQKQRNNIVSPSFID